MAKLIARKTYTSSGSATSGITTYGTVRQTNPAPAVSQRARRRNRVRLRARSASKKSKE